MAQVKKKQIQTKQSKLEKRDILTEMFEHFGIQVIDATPQPPKPSKKNTKMK